MKTFKEILWMFAGFIFFMAFPALLILINFWVYIVGVILWMAMVYWEENWRYEERKRYRRL